MPRPTATPEAQELEAQEPIEQEQTEKPKRQRRHVDVPDGVTIGLSQPRKGQPPAGTRGRAGGRTSEQTKETVALLESDPGEWYFIGTFTHQAAPNGYWKAHGIRFSSRKRDDGLFDRYAMKPADSGNAEAAAEG